MLNCTSLPRCCPPAPRSFEELRAFVRWLRPAQITPSVGNTSDEAAAEMVARLLGD